MKYIWICLLILTVAATGYAGTFDIFGTGARAIAMGGAYTAISDDTAGVFYNIAGISQVERLYLTIEYSYAQPELILNGANQDIDQHRGTTVGAIVSTRILNRRFSLGAHAYIPDDHLMRFLVLPIDQPHHAFAHNANHTITAMSGLGVEVFDWLRVGAGANVLATEKGGVIFTINEKSPSEGSEFSEFTPNYGVLAGVLAQPFEWWRIGFTFRDKVELTLNLPNEVTIPPVVMFDGNDIAIVEESYLDIVAVTNCHFTPRSYDFGMAFEPIERWLLSFSINYSEWSAMSSDAPYATVEVRGGLGELFPTYPTPQPEPPEFNDVWSPSFGTEYGFLDTGNIRLDVRGGYRFRPTPIPEQRYENNYLDTDVHIFSAGLGFTGDRLSKYLPRKVKFDGFFQYQYGPERIYHKAEATDVLGDMEFSQKWYNIGASMSLGF